MNRPSVSGAALAVVLALGCSSKKQGQSAPKPGEPGQTPAVANNGTKPTPATVAPKAAPSRGPEHAVYSLIDNRLAAHRFCGNSFVAEAGSLGFYKYTRFGNTVKGANKAWQLGQRDGELAVAKLRGSTASMFVPLTKAQAAANVVRIRTHADQKQAITLSVNGTKTNLEIEGGWVTTSIKVDNLKAGENELTWFMGKEGVSVAWVAVGDAAIADEILPASWTGKALAVPDGCGMAWYAMVPEASLLSADIADGACKLAVTATGEDGKVVTGELAGTGAAVDLAPLAGQAARIELAATGCKVAELSKAALVRAGEQPKAMPRGEPPKYVVMWIMDSLRADRVRPFNAKARPEAPTFEALLADSAMFTQMYTQGNESRVSHASIWTSLYPIIHKSIDEKDYLSNDWFSVEQVAKKAKLGTFGVSANGYIHTKRGFGDQWDQYANHIQQSRGLKGADILKQGLAWVETRKEPWFLYMGTIDTHVTWRAKSPWIEKYSPSYTGKFATEFGDDGNLKERNASMTDADKEHVRALYDSNVSYQDDLVKQFIEKLKAAGIWEQTMLIISADHGDEQWEDGRVGHGGSVRDSLVHVPLVVHYPPMVKPGLVSAAAESIDIVPTIAEALGVPRDKAWQGRSLLAVADGSLPGVEYPSLSVASQQENFHGGRIGHWKIRLAGAGKPTLYNLAKDKNEQTDVYGNADTHIGARLMLDAMWQWRYWNDQWDKSKWGTAANVAPGFADDVSK